MRAANVGALDTFAALPHPGEHILLICHTFPPSPGIGGRRWAKFAKALAQRGHVVHVLCAEAREGSAVSPWTSDVQHPNIVVHPLPRRYPSVLNRWPLTRLTDKLAYRFWLRFLPLLTRGNPLDATIFWEGQLLEKAIPLITQHSIRNVIVSGAPFRNLVHGLALKKRVPQINLVSDLRDPWTWWDNYGHSLLSPARFAQEQAFERAVMLGSDRITSPHQPVVDHIRSSYPEAASHTLRIPHAMDPEDIGTPGPLRTSGPFHLIYAGTLYGASEADAYFEAVIKAFQRLRTMAPTTASEARLSLYITANDASRYIAKVAEAGLTENIRFEAPVPPKEILKRIADADASLVFIPSKNKDLLGTKFDELFHLRRPVVHVGEEGTVSSTIEAGRLGISLRVAELEEELPRIMLRERVLYVDPAYDTRSTELDFVTDRLLREVLV